VIPIDQNPDHPIDDLVRHYLLADAATVDADALVSRIQATQIPATPRSHALSRLARIGWFVSGLALAASVAMLFLLAGPTTKIATAAELLTAAQSEHERPRDRCYQLTIEVETGLARLLDLPPIVRKSNVWTRGDQFFLETSPPNPKWPPLVWGQDATGRVWVVMSKRQGLLFEPDEIHEPVANACHMMSLRTVTLLRELLTNDYDLSRRDPTKAGETYRVEASFRRERNGPPPKIRDVVLELDPATKEIRKAVIKRAIPAPLAGIHLVTVTFELIDTATLNDDQYTLAGHLEANANILDRREPDRKMRIQYREEMMKRFSERILKP
jgi:hypothetical protein